jgi:hypothetical protein
MSFAETHDLNSHKTTCPLRFCCNPFLSRYAERPANALVHHPQQFDVFAT